MIVWCLVHNDDEAEDGIASTRRGREGIINQYRFDHFSMLGYFPCAGPFQVLTIGGRDSCSTRLPISQKSLSEMPL